MYSIRYIPILKFYIFLRVCLTHTHIYMTVHSTHQHSVGKVQPAHDGTEVPRGRVEPQQPAVRPSVDNLSRNARRNARGHKAANKIEKVEATTAHRGSTTIRTKKSPVLSVYECAGGKL